MKPEFRNSKRLLLENLEIVDDALRRAVRHALLMHKRAGNPIVTWRDGKVVWIPAEEIVVPTDDTEAES